MKWLFLVAAGLLEIGWAVGLKYTQGFTRPWPGVIAMSDDVKRRVDDLWKKAGL